MINIDKKSEGLDYEIIPASELPDAEQAWDIRILTGEFSETVVRYGNISVDGKEGALHFNFTIASSPDKDLTPDYVPFQDECGSILHDILENALTKDEVILTERK